MQISQEMIGYLEMVVQQGKIIEQMLKKGEDDLKMFDEAVTEILGAINPVMEEMDGGW
tara:strand:- start:4149 stop:4322 length:174 start_codon:yes stop_codon:yes gene_type:complete